LFFLQKRNTLRSFQAIACACLFLGDVSVERDQLLLAEYTEVCKSYQGISDFRGKLLALLPIVSGAGISLLVSKNYSIDSSHLFAVGIFGALVSLGLFFYELRGIQKCKGLIKLAAQLESALKMEAGQFSDRPKRLAGFIGAETAGWVVYMTVLSGWLYVAWIGVRAMR
jgi:hypothetical protein